MRARKLARASLRVGTVLGAILLSAVIIWIDLNTSVWQEMVILAGLAAGLVSFLLTTVVIGRIVTRQTALRWEPVTHLALSEILHEVADEDRSELSRGMVVPRTINFPETVSSDDRDAALEHLRHRVLAERRHLARTLGTWSEFLSSTGDNEAIMLGIAQLALQLDAVRDLALELEATSDEVQGTHPHERKLREAIDVCNSHIAELTGTIERRVLQERGRALSERR